jgi:hypothetical protein
MTEPKTSTLAVPGAVLHYDVRAAEPPVLREADPAAFGLPAEDDGSRDDPLFRHNILTCPATSTTSARCGRRQRAWSSESARTPRRC